MDSHPEEFSQDRYNRWSPIMEQVIRRTSPEPAVSPALPFLSDEEVTLIYGKWLSIQGMVFTDSVMRAIMLEDGGEELGQHPYVDTLPTNTLSTR
jgi:hypothetical protein